MKPEILEYVRSQRVGSLALEMMDGSPHGSTVHFAHAEDPLVFIFLTERRYRKSEPLFGKETTRASFVIGTTEEDKKTFQMDGVARLLNDETQYLEEVYFKKFPDKKEKYEPPEDFFFSFTPTWWRYTNWRAPEGKAIYSSKD